MAESCTSSETQGSSLCGLQMTCSSDITSSLKKQLHHGSQETMLDDSLLHLDNPELKCGGAGYKHASDNGYSENNLPMDVSGSEKGIDSYKTPGSHQTDTGMISNKESSTLLPSPLLTSGSVSKSSLSSAFMISSLLSTKAVSSFTTILTQACSGKQGQQLKIINSTTNCDALQRATTESSNKVCETKQNTLSLEADSQNELGNVVVHDLKHSKGISLDGNTGQPAGAQLDTEQRTSAEIQIKENSIGIVSALRRDVEDMQVEETSSLTVKGPVLGADMINPGTMNEPGTSLSELKIKKMIDGQSVSALVTNLHNKADALIEDSVPDELDEKQAAQNTAEDVLLIDESADADIADCVLESNPAATCVGTVDVTEGVTLLAAADLNSSEGCTLVSKSHIMSPRENSGSLGVCSSENTISDDQAILDYSVKSQQSDISDNSVLDISDVENTQIQAEVKLGITSDRGEEVLKGDATQADQSLMKGGVQLCAVAEKEALQTEAHKHHLVGVTSLQSPEDSIQVDADSELADVEMSVQCEGTYENTSKLKANLHSTDVSDSLVNCSETNNLNKETEVHLGVSLEKKDRIQETDANLPPHETNSAIVSNPLMVTNESFSNQDKAGDKVEENKASAEKFSFKNILFMTKDKTASKKNTTVVEESELTSTEPVVIGRSEITVNTVSEKAVTQSATLDTTSSQIPKKESDMDTESSERGLETVNERKRLQTENFVSASKRSKLDSMSGSDDKVVKDNIAKLDKVVLAEKCLPSTEVKNTVKTKDEKAVLLSNEVLQSLITLRVKAFIKNQKQANIERLNLRTRGMQSASNLWKETAKHLEKSVLELTALNQKLESRKAHLIAVKRLASRTMSTQTGEDSTSSSSSAAPAPSSTPTPAQRTLPASTTQPAVYRTGRPGRPPLYRQIPSIPPPVPPPPVAAPEKTPPSNKTTDAAVSKNSVNMIDLTDDDETSRNVIAETSKVVAPQQHNQAGNKQYTGGVPVAVPPANGYIRQRPQVQGLSGTLFGSSGQITQSSISGSQHLTTSNTADSQPHLVTPASSAAHQSGTANPPGSRSAVAPSTYSPAGQSNMPASSRNLVQNTPPPAVASPSASGAGKTSALSLPPSFLISPKHPAPLPSNMDTGNAPQTAKKRPPKPSLKISRVSQGIVLSWNMPSLFDVEKIAAYQLYAYQESDSATPRSSLWKKVGEVAALPLPMACTLTQFQEGNKYHFAVRAVDQYGRCGIYSDPSSIYLGQKS